MRMLIVYSSKYGQTEKIAKRIGELIEAGDGTVETLGAAQALQLSSVENFDCVILGSPIYIGNHSRQLAQFIRKFNPQFVQTPTAFFSVSVSAAGGSKQRGDATRCMNQFLCKCDFQPSLKTIFAGALPYRKYNWMIRMLMKWIASREGGHTDTSKNHEFTNWDDVDEFARLLIDESKTREAA